MRPVPADAPIVRAPESDAGLSLVIDRLVPVALAKLNAPSNLAGPETYKLVEVTPPTICKPPCTAKVSIGEEELIPTLPFVKIRNKLAPVDEAISNRLVPPMPFTAKLAIGEVELMPKAVPTKPVPEILKLPVCKVPEVAPCRLTNPMVVVVTQTGVPLPADRRI